ncbi:hypothetical protein LB503_005425 [Fusarium chuoi]|nr:hypothetical protein LB503_005425 [Fusarium chuoi]
MSRVSSLPPTREVDEEDEQQTPTRSASATHAIPHYDSRYNPASPPKSTQTPPPPSYAGQLTLSPPKQSGPLALYHLLALRRNHQAHPSAISRLRGPQIQHADPRLPTHTPILLK